MKHHLTDEELGMGEWYFSATDERKDIFAEKVDDALEQVRNEQLGKHIKSIGFDEDRDFALLVDETEIDNLRRIAIDHKLVVYRLAARERE